MIPRMLFASLSALPMFLPIRDAAAVEPLSTTELAEHCTHYAEDPEGKDAIFCVRYVQGFIDGVVATDERVTRNVAVEYERKETYTERAIRTRSARRVPARLSRYGATVYAEFCLGAPVPLKEVVEHVIMRSHEPQGPRRTTSRARRLVRGATQRLSLQDER